jgi:hypothetical protein
MRLERPEARDRMKAHHFEIMEVWSHGSRRVATLAMIHETTGTELSSATFTATGDKVENSRESLRMPCSRAKISHQAA